MKITVVLSRVTANMLWAQSDPAREWRETGETLPDGCVLCELDERVVSDAIDLFDAPTFDEAIRLLVHMQRD